MISKQKKTSPFRDYFREMMYQNDMPYRCPVLDKIRNASNGSSIPAYHAQIHCYRKIETCKCFSNTRLLTSSSAQSPRASHDLHVGTLIFEWKSLQKITSTYRWAWKGRKSKEFLESLLSQSVAKAGKARTSWIILALKDQIKRRVQSEQHLLTIITDISYS